MNQLRDSMTGPTYLILQTAKYFDVLLLSIVLKSLAAPLYAAVRSFLHTGIPSL